MLLESLQVLPVTHERHPSVVHECKCRCWVYNDLRMRMRMRMNFSKHAIN